MIDCAPSLRVMLVEINSTELGGGQRQGQAKSAAESPTSTSTCHVQAARGPTTAALENVPYISASSTSSFMHERETIHRKSCTYRRPTAPDNCCAAPANSTPQMPFDHLSVGDHLGQSNPAAAIRPTFWPISCLSIVHHTLHSDGSSSTVALCSSHRTLLLQQISLLVTAVSDQLKIHSLQVSGVAPLVSLLSLT